MDFKNAFPTMSHEMVAAALGLMCIPFVRALYLYSLGKGYVPGVYHHPHADTRQGDPLSPARFSLVASFVIFALQDLDPGLTVCMYADDSNCGTNVPGMVGRLLRKIPSQGGFDTPTVHVQNWSRAWLLQFYASQPSVRDPQTPEVWEQWTNAQLPPRVKDFAQRLLWHKLTVHERVYKR